MKTVEERFWSKVEKSETCWLWTAARSDTGYGSIRVKVAEHTYRAMNAHRLAYVWAYGEPEPGLLIDHICRVRHCVRPDHMRAVTYRQNAENLPQAGGRNTSGYRGVYWDKANSKWRALLTVDGRHLDFGRHVTKEAAAAAVLAGRLQYETHNEVDRQTHAATHART
jgi:hypothetical protein